VNLGTLSADTASKLDILWHNSDTLGVNGAQIGVLEQSHQVCLASLLQEEIICQDRSGCDKVVTYLESPNGSRLEPQISFEVLSDFSYKTLERQLPDEELSGLLVSPDLTESDSSWPVSVGLLDSSC